MQKWSAILRLLPFQTESPAQPASGPGDASTPSKAAVPNKIYTTSIHASVSSFIKLSRSENAREGRRAFRALEVLDPMLFDSRGRVELGFLSCTMDKDIAARRIKGQLGTGVLLEFDSGEVGCSARLDSISQYPGQGGIFKFSI